MDEAFEILKKFGVDETKKIPPICPGQFLFLLAELHTA